MSDPITQPAPASGGGWKRLVYLLPVLVLLGLLGFLAKGLTLDPRLIPSALIDKPAPNFVLPPMEGQAQGFSTADLKGHVSLVNTFASWCVPCREEMPDLMALAARNLVPIYGIDYKDKPQDGAAWIDALGNPYTRIGADLDGKVGIEWGVYGVPETYVIDARGHIRHKFVGPLTKDDIEHKLVPLVEKLKAQ